MSHDQVPHSKYIKINFDKLSESTRAEMQNIISNAKVLHLHDGTLRKQVKRYIANVLKDTYNVTRFKEEFDKWFFMVDAACKQGRGSIHYFTHTYRRRPRSHHWGIPKDDFRDEFRIDEKITLLAYMLGEEVNLEDTPSEVRWGN